MQVNAISNTAFGGKTKKTPEQKAADKTRYYEYLSKFNANKALVMSKGREEEDGKYKAISGFAGIGAFATGITAMVKFLDAKSLVNTTKNAAERSIDVAIENGNKFVKNMRTSKALGIAALALGTVAAVAKGINEAKAQKTANERGFYTDKQIYNLKGSGEKRANAVYDMVENAYDGAVK